MTKEEKQLLLKDLCSRLPYGVKCLTFDRQVAITGKLCSFSSLTDGSVLFGLTDKTYDAPDKYYQPQAIFKYEIIKPYLRPLQSMTEDERNEMKKMLCPTGTGSFDEEGLIVPMSHFGDKIHYDFMSRILDWLNARHFDHRGLIEMGLAFKAHEGMYETKTE